MEPVFNFSYPPNCPSGESNQLSVFDGQTHVWRFRRDSLTYPSAATSAVDSLALALEKIQTAVALAAGDILIVDNHRVTHGRTAFASAQYGAEQRHMRRTYATERE